jgi:dienelactone hydrolase
MTKVNLLAGWESEEFTSAGITHQVWRSGSGPGVVVIHEIPGITPTVARFAEELVAAGFRVALPLLVGEVGPPPSAGYLARSLAKVCISREFTTWATGQSSPIVAWLRALGRHLHLDCGGPERWPGIGAVGMCFSGGFVLGMMMDDHLLAPVASQPSLPFAVGAKRSEDLGISAEESAAIRERIAEGCSVMALRFTGDRLVGDRFATLRELCSSDGSAPGLLTVELPSHSRRDHSLLTEQRDETAVADVIAFLKHRLAESGL